MSAVASDIHAKTYAMITTGMGSKFKTYRKVPMLQFDPTDLPSCAVYITRERREAFGNANHGAPTFRHELTITIAAAMAMRRQEQDELTILEERFDEIDILLLRNPEWVILTEGVQSMERQSQYSKVGDTPVAEIKIEMVLVFHTVYEPIITDTLETIHVETRYPSPDVDPAKVQQVSAVYDLPQN